MVLPNKVVNIPARSRWVFLRLCLLAQGFGLRRGRGKRSKVFAVFVDSIRFSRPCRTIQRYALAASCGFASRPSLAHQNSDSEPPGTAQRRALLRGHRQAANSSGGSVAPLGSFGSRLMYSVSTWVIDTPWLSA
mgnify:FL=1